MSALNEYIRSLARREARKEFQNFSYFRKSQNSCSGLAKIKEFKDGKWTLELADGTIKEVDPSGIRSVGSNGIVYLSNNVILG